MGNLCHSLLVSDTTTHEQATILLNNLWAASNTAEKLLWQAQSDTDDLVAQNAQQQITEDQAQKEAKEQKEKEDLCKEECKNNHGKFLPIPNFLFGIIPTKG